MSSNVSEQEVSALSSPCVPRVKKPRRTYGRRNLRLLPDDIDVNYSKWFYEDISKMKSRPKNLRPVQCSQSHQPGDRHASERIEPNNFRYLTQDIEQPGIIPIRKITNYKLSCFEKELIHSVTDQQEHCYSRTVSKQFQLTIKPQVTIIDSRPMIKMNLMKRQKIEAQSSNPTTNEKQAPPLIDPEEDCDSTDDEEIIEIDCDTGSRFILGI